jgi:hypothetical protein
MFSEHPFFYPALKPIENDEVFLIVTPGEPFSSYEKLLLPFDARTWEYLLITSGCAFLMSYGINLMSKKIQFLGYGESVRSPVYNLVGKLNSLQKYF